MTEDSVLIGLVSLVWIALAALYAFEPMFAMPGSAIVWGSGAAVFLALAAITAIAERRLRQAGKRDR
ncbi:MAG: hypothetical protein Q8L54_11480 [Devosia sp.]|nr:hypothetical protein [Devosia sp.]